MEDKEIESLSHRLSLPADSVRAVMALTSPHSVLLSTLLFTHYKFRNMSAVLQFAHFYFYLISHICLIDAFLALWLLDTFALKWNLLIPQVYLNIYTAHCVAPSLDHLVILREWNLRSSLFMRTVFPFFSFYFL